MPAICLIENGLINADTYIVEYQSGGKIIHFAAHFGKLKAFKTLVERYKANVEILDSYNMTPAHYAARTGELSILLYLQDKADLNRRDSFQNTPLHYATMFNKVHSFIFLFFKQHYKFYQPTLMNTLMTMPESSDCTDILSILVHIEELQDTIASYVLF